MSHRRTALYTRVMAAVRLIGYKHFVIAGVSLGAFYVWMSIHFSSNHTLQSFDSTRGLQNPQNVRTWKKKVPKENKRSYCNIELPFLGVLDNEASCKLKIPYDSSCSVSEQLFSEAPATCGQDSISLCKLSADDMGVTCDLTDCQAGLAPVDVGYLDKTTGSMIWTQKTQSSSAQSLAAEVNNLIVSQNTHGYVYLRCSESKKTQLLVLPVSSVFTRPHSNKKITITPHINVNMIFIDSVSFFHFHRTLPDTVHKLSEISKTDTKVLSYPLYQSIKSRTYENLQALFSGEVDIHNTFSVQAMPNSPLKLQVLYKPLAELGYTNMFMEDLCWSWEWGISKDLLVHNKSLTDIEYWRRLLEAFKAAGIDSYGISPSSCEILRANSHPDPFHGMPTVCYNGMYQHTYLMEHLRRFQILHETQGKPFSTFYSCNVPHDECGRRVKTLDSDLSDHIQHASQLDNTISILFSDHGNTYGQFVQTEQGRDESYHPVLYIIAPPGVQKNLGEEIISNLITNQARLVTVMDLHHMLRYVAHPGQSRDTDGIVSKLPAHRSCADLPLFTPNICICDTEDSGGLSDTELGMIAEFAAGYLTNELTDDVKGIQNLKCRVLLPISYSHPQTKTHQDGLLVVTMDLKFASPKSDVNETILVSVFYKPINKGNNRLQLKDFARRSTYSIYRHCGNGQTTESLCICEKDQRYTLNIAHNWLKGTRRSDIISLSESHKLDNCIYIIQYIINAGASSLYVINVCEVASYGVKVKLEFTDAVSYSYFPDSGIYIKPFDIQFLFVYKLLTIPARPVKLNKIFSFHLMQS